MLLELLAHAQRSPFSAPPDPVVVIQPKLLVVRSGCGSVINYNSGLIQIKAARSGYRYAVSIGSPDTGESMEMA